MDVREILGSWQQAARDLKMFHRSDWFANLVVKSCIRADIFRGGLKLSTLS